MVPGRKAGAMLGEIFKKVRPEIRNPATLKRLIVDLLAARDSGQGAVAQPYVPRAKTTGRT